MIFEEDVVIKRGVLLLWSSPAFVLTPCPVIVCNLQPTVESQSQLSSLAQELLEAACDNHRGALTNTGVVCYSTPSIALTTTFILPQAVETQITALHACAQHQDSGLGGISSRPPPSPNRTVLESGAEKSYGEGLKCSCARWGAYGDRSKYSLKGFPVRSADRHTYNTPFSFSFY